MITQSTKNRVASDICVMFPSSAAMLKNLQQSAMATSPFLMDNLLSKGPGGDFASLTLNLASYVARQRERMESESIRVEREQQDFERIQGREDRERVQSLKDSRSQDIDLERRSSSGMDVDSNDHHGADGGIDRLNNAMERLAERMENRSGSAMDSNHSMEEDKVSPDADNGVQERDRLSIQMDRGFDMGRNIIRTSDEMRMHIEREGDRMDRISEETCTCGDDRCTGTGCRRVQEKEKPQLKFSVNAILGGNHDRRPNPGNHPNTIIITRLFPTRESLII